MFNKLMASCVAIPTVTSEAAAAYIRATSILLNNIGNQLDSNLKTKELIGHNPREIMLDNQRYHTELMSTVFKLNSYELLVRTIPWTYRVYHARGFSYEYFPAKFIAYQVAIRQCLENQAHQKEVNAVYSWMVQHHSDIIALSLAGDRFAPTSKHDQHERQKVFLTILLQGDTQRALKLAEESINTIEELKIFYLDIICPALYQIGHMWEINQISVAEEHLATAIAGRIMAATYLRIVTFATTRGKVVVAAVPNECHEVGARMVADFLEIDGWDVTFLGANTPANELIDVLKKQQPFAVALSVATVFNIEKAHHVIRMIQNDHATRGIKIMVGGLAFHGMPDLWQKVGADGFAPDADGATGAFNRWWMERDT